MDVPGAFIQADMDEVDVRFSGEMVKKLFEID